MKKLILTLAVCTFFVFVIDGCKKPVRGCMDSSATNYNSSADESDGNCKYSGKIVCYLKGSSYSTFVAYSTNALTFYVDGTSIGTLYISQCLTGEPPCSQTSNVLTKTYDLGGSISKTAKLKIIDEDGYVWADQDMPVNNAGSGICNLWAI